MSSPELDGPEPLIADIRTDSDVWARSDEIDLLREEQRTEDLEAPVERPASAVEALLQGGELENMVSMPSVRPASPAEGETEAMVPAFAMEAPRAPSEDPAAPAEAAPPVEPAPVLEAQEPAPSSPAEPSPVPEAAAQVEPTQPDTVELEISVLPVPAEDLHDEAVPSLPSDTAILKALVESSARERRRVAFGAAALFGLMLAFAVFAMWQPEPSADRTSVQWAAEPIVIRPNPPSNRGEPMESAAAPLHEAPRSVAQRPAVHREAARPQAQQPVRKIRPKERTKHGKGQRWDALHTRMLFDASDL